MESREWFIPRDPKCDACADGTPAVAMVSCNDHEVHCCEKHLRNLLSRDVRERSFVYLLAWAGNQPGGIDHNAETHELTLTPSVLDTAPSVGGGN